MDAGINFRRTVVDPVGIRADKMNITVSEEFLGTLLVLFICFVVKADCIYLNQRTILNQHAYHCPSNIEISLHMSYDGMISVFCQRFDDLEGFTWLGIRV